MRRVLHGRLLQGDLWQVQRRQQRDLADGRDHGRLVCPVRWHVRRQALQRREVLQQAALQGRAVGGHAVRGRHVHARQRWLLAVPLSSS